MIHTVIVPGVGGSEHDHWQSWLQRQLKSCSRVQQQDWNKPYSMSGLNNLSKQFNPFRNRFKLWRIALAV